jgi:hypothetical protein
MGMRRTALSGGFRVVFWVVLALVLVAPCLHLAAGADHFRIGGKHVYSPSVPWASAAPGVTLDLPAARQAPLLGFRARLPLIVRAPFVPPEA